jgi:hypothetical protein
MREIKPCPIIDKLINRFDSWLKHREEIRGTRRMAWRRLVCRRGLTTASSDFAVVAYED